MSLRARTIVYSTRRVQPSQALLEWMAKRFAQEAFAGINQEYPVNDATRWDPIVESWGEFKADKLSLETASH